MATLAQTTDAKRHALLIANRNYKSLARPADMRQSVLALEKALRETGFSVTRVEDVTVDRIISDIEPAFMKSVKPGDACFFYYFGHAIQWNQDNFLLPIDYNPGDAGDISQKAYSLTRLQQLLNDKKAAPKIIALELAPPDPAVMAQATGVGLTNPDVSDTSDVLFLFSHVPNQIVAENQGALTTALTDTLNKQGLDLNDVMQNVQREVAKSTSQQQRAFAFSNVPDTFYFRDPVVGPEAGMQRTSRKDRQDYVFVPAGTFTMGCVPSDTRCEDVEKPQHEVRITKSFWMGATEVNVTAWERFMDSTGRKKMPEGPFWDTKRKLKDHPMTSMPWEEAQAFCEWSGGRLPTEAEWEYAARGGEANQVWPHNTQNSREKANFAGKKGNDRFDNTSPVKQFDPNPFRLFDMSGNVWEWCSDWFSETAFRSSDKDDPKGPAAGKQHVVRGGSWFSDANEHLRISIRKPNTGGNIVGFRCVLEDSPATKKLLGDY
ncbi:MAG: SUMF1/EgtB/PvdO family nonheme iron enzyme [Bryobacteraceae bacterium]|nr:SUMF1/EgtB/PvdO family nonheme iron enzyme [Bryobacteraceae bacterium]